MENRAPVCLIKAGAARVCRPCEPHPPQCARWGSLPLLAPFGRHFPLTGGIGLPLKGKAFWRPKAAPTAESGLGALVRQTQAQKRNRISPNFPPAQAPGGAGRNRTQALLFCAPEMFCPLQGVTPVTGVRGKGEYGHEVSILSRPPAILWVLSHRADLQCKCNSK